MDALLTASRAVRPSAAPRRQLLSSVAGMAAPTAVRRMSSLAASWPTSHATQDSSSTTRNFINNKFVQSSASNCIDVHDPATNHVVARVPESTDEELKAAVEAAQKAFPAWRDTSILRRQQVMFKFVALIWENWDRLAAYWSKAKPSPMLAGTSCAAYRSPRLPAASLHS